MNASSVQDGCRYLDARDVGAVVVCVTIAALYCVLLVYKCCVRERTPMV